MFKRHEMDFKIRAMYKMTLMKLTQAGQELENSRPNFNLKA